MPPKSQPNPTHGSSQSAPSLPPCPPNTNCENTFKLHPDQSKKLTAIINVYNSNPIQLPAYMPELPDLVKYEAKW
jgi:hypothetical protein